MILVFGSINFDTIYALDALPTPGVTQIGTGASEPGGKGANQAVAAARDGGAVAMVGAVGQDIYSEPALAGLLAAGVDLTRIARVPGATGTAAVCVDAAGANQIAVATGANAQLRAAHVPDKDLQPGTTLVLQGEVDPAESAALIRRARTQGARIVLNLAPAGPFEADALAMVDWLVVNEAEAAALSRQLGISADAPSLRSALNVGVVCTKGRLGVELAAAGAVLSLASLQVDVVDSTAAGDCLTGVFAAALDRGMAAENALRRANVAAAACCNRRGSQSSLPDKAEIDAKVKAYNPFATV